MSFQGNDNNSDVQSYYFADHCLQVRGGDFSLRSPLNHFADRKPYSTKSSLTISPYEPLDEKDIILVAQESGVSIFRRPTGQWILKSPDPVNPCRIETDGSYSDLKGFTVSESNDEYPAGFDSFLHLLRITSESFLCSHGGLSVHASCVKYKGKAILFAAPSGTGKSSQAKFWLQSLGAELLSGDRPQLRVMPDEISAYGVPWDGKEQQFTSDFAPVAAIVEVRQAKTNRLRKLSEEQAFRLLLKQTFIPMWDDQVKFSAIRSIREIANRVPFYRLFCSLDEDAVTLLENAVYQKAEDKIGNQEDDMQIKDGFILRNIVDEWIVMPKGTNIKDFEGAIVLNEVSAHIWRQLERPISLPDLLQTILDEFDVTEEAARSDLDDFLSKLREYDMLLEE